MYYTFFKYILAVQLISTVKKDFKKSVTVVIEGHKINLLWYFTVTQSFLLQRSKQEKSFTCQNPTIARLIFHFQNFKALNQKKCI